MTSETSTEIGADLRHVRSWVFDLDNTLYPPESLFLKQVEQRINQYVVRTSGLESAEALAIQRGYLHDYGTSLAGLMMHYQIDPHDFLAEVHDVPLDVLTPDPGLHAALERLSGPPVASGVTWPSPACPRRTRRTARPAWRGDGDRPE